MAENERHMIDPNAAEAEALSELPGIGPVLAQRIIDARPFDRPEDLTRVRGIGPSILARLRPQLAFAEPGPAEGGGTREPANTTALVDVAAPQTREREAVESARDAVEAPASPVAREEVEESEATMDAPTEQPEVAEEGAAAEPPVGPPLPAEQAEEELPEAEEAGLVAKAPALPSVPEEVDEVATPVEAPLEPPEAGQAAPGEEQQEVEREEDTVEGEQAGAEERAVAERKGEPRPVRRGWVLWTVVGSALLVLVLSVALSLGMLATINDGRLEFASPAELGALTVRVEGLEWRASELSEEVQGLRARLDNVEAFGGRIDALEESAQELRADLEDTANEVQGLSGEVDDLGQEVKGLGQNLAKLGEEMAGLESEVQALQEQSARTQSFFDGLRNLLDELFAQEGGVK